MTISQKTISFLLSLIISISIVICPVFSRDSYALVSGDSIVAEARKYIGKTTYQWGGTDLNGYCDCSGFVCRIYEKFGIDYWKHRTDFVAGLADIGTSMGTNTANAKAGDIVVWSGHCGIAVDSRTVVQCGVSGTKELSYSAMGLELVMIIRPFAVSSSGISGYVTYPADDFYAYIISPQNWIKLESSSNNNVQITNSSDSETNSSCIWRFEKQSNGNYVIYNQKNGYVLSASGGGTTNGTNVNTNKEYTGGSNQQWLLYETGSGVIIKSASCSLVLDCAGGAQSAGTNIQLWESNNTQAQRFNVYTIAKRWNPADGYDPFAYLIRKKPWLHVENTDSSNVQIRSGSNDSYDPKQIWWFCKLSDGSFNISNEYNKLSTSAYLTAPSSLASGNNVSTSNYSDSVRQRWYIYRLQEEYGTGFVLRPKGGELVLNCNGGASTAGTKINLYAFNRGDGQIFDIWHLSNDKTTYSRPSNPSVPTITVPSSAVVGQNISVSWTSSPLVNSKFDARSYRVEILDNANKVVKQLTTTSLSTTIAIDTAGNYSAQVRAINTKYPGDSTSAISTRKTIIVSQPVKKITSTMISNIPDQIWSGVAISPEVTIVDGTSTLKKGTDYTVTCSNNTNVGEAILTVTGIGNYSGTVVVKFNIVKASYSVSLNDVINGTVTLSKTSASEGDEITVTATPATGFTLDKITVNGTAISGNKFTMPAKSTTVAVTFKKVAYTVSLSSITNGTASLSKTSANYGDEITVTAIPATGYTLNQITVNGTAINGNKFTMPAKNTTVAVTFKNSSYTISLGTVTNGTASLSKTTANAGDEITITVTPASGYELDKITVNGTAISGNKFTMPASDTSVVVTFKEKVHTLTKVSAKAATCTEEGNITYYICKDTDCGCKKIYSDAAGQNEITLADTVVPATGHSLEKVSPKAATCTEDGHLGYWKCTKCGKMFADEDGKTAISASNVTVEALGHDVDHIDYVNEKPATYKDDGHKGYYLCPRCGKKFKDPNCTIPVTDAELLIPKKGAAVLGEEATVGDFNYRVTYQATDGTGTVTLIGVDNKTASAVIPSTVEIKGNTYKVNRIGPSAFSKNTIVTSVYIGVNVAIIDNNAFLGCSNLVKVSGGAGLKTIGTKAFTSCPKLKTFVITSKVLWKIGPYSFYGDKSLKTIYIKNTTKLVKSGVKKSLKGSKVKTVKVKKSKVKKYKKYFKKSNSGRKVKVKK